ncbi:cell wall hydrolase [Sphingomonas canadensis]|nr:cell wall hydrolase [Sphingomonas canadensis]
MGGSATAQAQGADTVSQDSLATAQANAVQAEQDEVPAQTAPVAAKPAIDDSALAAASMPVDSELVCLAKVIVHEAGNQSREGQLAVAQVVMNRLRSPKFPKTICSVVMQRGQFFNVHAYNPPKDKRWTLALEIARDARAGVSDPVVGNALFFRAAQVNPAFFRSRPIVGRIGNHYFHE